MELVKNIFFNTDRLTSNSTVKISYIGKFFQDDSTNVIIHYGFGNSWENLSESEMKKTDLGYQIEINLIDSETFNFCFKNNKDEWDNNNGENYIFTIEHPDTSIAIYDENLLTSRKGLRKSYIISKKIRLALYKMIITIPKLISGNFKKKLKRDTN